MLLQMFSALVVEWNKENLLTFSLPAHDTNVSMFFKFFLLPLFGEGYLL